jgi:transposase-like protein
VFYANRQPDVTQKSWTFPKPKRKRPEMPRKHHHHSTAEERLHAQNYLNQGKTIKQTAKLCGVSPSTIKHWNRQLKLRGKSYLKPKKRSYTVYPVGTKCSAVREYLNGRDATEVAAQFGILNPQSITTWARDERFRGGISLEDETRPSKNNERRKSIKPLEDMTPEEELEFLRMENAILKKQIALRTEQKRSKKR